MTNPILKDGERIDQLFSTDVKIIQNKEVFSYSIDSVLLSRFPKIPKKGLIVDLCSGNGAVGLFASTRTEAPITLVELQERLADMAKRSVTLNQLEDQVTVVNDEPEKFAWPCSTISGGSLFSVTHLTLGDRNIQEESVRALPLGPSRNHNQSRGNLPGRSSCPQI